MVAFVATLVTAVMISAVDKTPAPSAARISAAIKSLKSLALGGTSHSGISWISAGLSPTDHFPGANMGLAHGTDYALVRVASLLLRANCAFPHRPGVGTAT